MQSLVNWNAIQELNSRSLPGGTLSEKDANEMWSRVAKTYDFMAELEKEYTLNQVNAMKLDKEDSVIDIGCGIGRLTVPIAHRVRKVTALDVADKMLEICKINVEKAGLDNVDYKKLDWNATDSNTSIEKHDIAFASRSVGLRDIIKLNNTAIKYAYLLSFTGYPSLRDVQMEMLTGIRGITKRQVNEEQSRMFGYNITFNLLYDLGIDPMVQVVEDGFERTYESKEEAYDDLRQVTVELSDNPDLTDEEERLFQRNVDEYITYTDGKYRFLRNTKTFVIGWKPITL